MKTEIQIAEKLHNLQTNIKGIHNEQGKAVTQSRIATLKWVLSNYEDKQDELNRKVQK